MMSTLPSTPQCSAEPRPLLADEADGVAVVDHHHGVVFLGEVADALEVGDDAVHREDAVGGDQPEARVGRFLQPRLEIGHVVVGVAVAPRLAEPHAVDDRGVVQRVRDDRVLLAEQRLEQPAIGVEAGAVEDRVLHAEKRGDLRLELLVLLLRAADEAHRGHAVAVAVERVLGGVAQFLIVGEAEIVVGAEIQHLAAADLDLGRLGRGDHPLGFVEPGRLQPVELGGEMGKEGFAHGSVDPLLRTLLPRPDAQVYRKIDVLAEAKWWPWPAASQSAEGAERISSRMFTICLQDRRTTAPLLERSLVRNYLDIQAC